MLASIRGVILLASLALAQQIPLVQDGSDRYQGPLRVAIIGGGIGGATVASRLAAFTSERALNVTVFERESRLGGRIESFVSDAEWGSYPLELGAYRGTADDTCLQQLVWMYGTEDADFSSEAFDTDMGFTSEKPLIMECDIANRDWRGFLQLLLKYGTSAVGVRNSIRRVRSGWQTFLDGSDSKVSLRDALGRAGFGEDLFKTAAQWFVDAMHGSAYAIEQDLIQPCTQARALKDHSESNAITALLASGAMRSGFWRYDGNVGLVEDAFAYARAVQHRAASVRAVTASSNGGYKLSWVDSKVDKTEEEEFDVVVLAAPYATAEISFDLAIPGLDLSQVPRIQYEERHVTYFTSPLDLTEEVKSLLNVVVRYDNARTGLVPQSNITSLEQQVVCYPSCRPGDPRCGEYSCENLYKVNSRHDGKEIDLTSMLNHNSRGRKDYRGKLPPGGVTWSKKKAWKQGLPDVSFATPDTAELAPGLYYTSGLEHIVSSMEMSCRMGRYVADQILATELQTSRSG